MLKNKKETHKRNVVMIIFFNSTVSIFSLIKYNINMIIKKLMVNKPLKPSIKLLPLTINNKDKQTNRIEIIL